MPDTIDKKAAEYTDTVELDENTYPGDVETAYVCGYMQSESDLICKLWETNQFTMSKIAEMLDKSLMETRNAVNQKEWR